MRRHTCDETTLRRCSDEPLKSNPKKEESDCDSRLQSDERVSAAWFRETSRGRYLKQSPDLFEQLGYRPWVAHSFPLKARWTGVWHEDSASLVPRVCRGLAPAGQPSGRSRGARRRSASVRAQSGRVRADRNHAAQKDQVSWGAYNLGVQTIDGAVTKNIEVGFMTVIPVGGYAALPRLRIGGRITDVVHLGLFGTGGAVGTYIESGVGVGFGGGGPLATFGTEKLFVNASAPFFGGATYGETETTSFWLGLPSVGFSARVSRAIRLNIELYKPLSSEFEDDNAKIWAVLYGIRIFGDELYGDVSFVVPIYPGVGEVLRYAPLGIPLLVFGYRWGGTDTHAVAAGNSQHLTGLARLP